jgi:hypothetical protein
MNLSSLSGESLAAILPPNADHTYAQLNSTGTVINFTGKGLFRISVGDSSNVIRLTVDDVQFADMAFSELNAVLGFYLSGSIQSYRFNKSLKVEITTYSSSFVAVDLIGA